MTLNTQISQPFQTVSKMYSFNAARRGSNSRMIFCVFLVGTTICDRRRFGDGERSTQPPRHAVHKLRGCRTADFQSRRGVADREARNSSTWETAIHDSRV